MPVKPCLNCGRLSTGTRCPAHTRTHQVQAQRAKRTRRPYTYEEQRRRAKAVDDWVAVHGWLCPGWRRPAHKSRDLTADHVHAVAAGGAEDGHLQVLCRSCNGRKAAQE
jgi:5-methylcytosine-specific restriction enzyme A